MATPGRLPMPRTAVRLVRRGSYPPNLDGETVSRTGRIGIYKCFRLRGVRAGGGVGGGDALRVQHVVIGGHHGGTTIDSGEPGVGAASGCVGTPAVDRRGR